MITQDKNIFFGDGSHDMRLIILFYDVDWVSEGLHSAVQGDHPGSGPGQWIRSGKSQPS